MSSKPVGPGFSGTLMAGKFRKYLLTRLGVQWVSKPGFAWVNSTSPRLFCALASAKTFLIQARFASPAPDASGVQDSTPGSDAGTPDGPLQQSAPASAG